MNSTSTQQLMPEKVFGHIRELIFRASGIRVQPYKLVALSSRIKKRMNDLHLSAYDDYYSHLLSKGGQEELYMLLDMVTTNVTSFFREESQFEYLSKMVLPGIVNRASQRNDRRIRLWSAGCSSGEEAYSLAISLMEGLPNPRSWDIKILASDISIAMLEKASKGIFRADVVEPLPPSRRYFFEKADGHYRAKPDLSDHIVFRMINLHQTTLPVRTQFDVIFCRNVMIYFDQFSQRRIWTKLISYLKPGGYLFVGRAESLLSYADLIQFVEPNIYQKRYS